jgi:hypothetical protein
VNLPGREWIHRCRDRYIFNHSANILPDELFVFSLIVFKKTLILADFTNPPYPKLFVFGQYQKMERPVSDGLQPQPANLTDKASRKVVLNVLRKARLIIWHDWPGTLMGFTVNSVGGSLG